MPLTQLFDESFFTGTVVATDVPWAWDVSLDGYPFMVDWHHVSYVGLREGSYTAESTPVIRQQADTGSEPGEQSLNPEAPWRRAAESWHMGAGQAWQDRKESDRFRFDTSKGVNPWTTYQLTLLNDTEQVASATTTNQYLAVGATELYRSDGQTISYSPDRLTWTDATGTPAADVTSLASDGATVYAAYGASGIYTGTHAFTQWVTDPVTLVRFCNGRVIAAQGAALYNPVASGALPTALATTVPTGWTWTDACSGGTFVYAAGYAGSQSAVYSIGLKSDASGLAAPQVAATMLPGEIVQALTNYQGFVVAHLNTGIRFGQADASSGALTFGALIPTPKASLCGATWDRFVWFGLSNYDTTSTGLGRLDPARFTLDLTPAYASDLMAAAQGDVTSCAVFGGVLCFAVSGSGVWVDSGLPVDSGSITSGRITFDLPDPKNALFLDVIHQPLAGEVDLSMLVEDTTTVVVGASTTAGSTTSGDLDCGQRPGRWFAVTLTLKPGKATTSSSGSGGGGLVNPNHVVAGGLLVNGATPVVNRVTLQAWPTPHRVETINVPLLFQETLVDNDSEHQFDCVAAEQKVQALRDSGQYVNFQFGTASKRVFVFDTKFIRNKMTTDKRGHEGTMVVTLREL